MPGNEVGDRVHNFFAQDNLSQGQHHSQVADGSWPSLNNNFWSGSQKQVVALSSTPRNYNSLQSDFERGDNGNPLHVSRGLDFTQTTMRPEYATSQPQSQQQNWNGYMHGRQNFPARQAEANFLGVDTESDRNNENPRSVFMFESQQNGVFENIAKNSVRPNTSDTPVSFDLFGGQQSSMLQGLPQQQSGFAEMQQLQQQLMFRKMQELQRQKESRQLDARQNNAVNQVLFFERQVSVGHPQSLIKGNPVPEPSTYQWGELPAGNTNWLQRTSSAMQGSSGGHVFSPEQSQTPHSMGFGQQQADQSLYGIPVSNSMGNLNHYPRMETKKTSIHQIAAYSNPFLNQYNVFPDQVTMEDETLASRQGFQGKSLHDNASGQSSNSGMSVDHPHLLNPLQQNSSFQEFQGQQELIGSSKILHDKKAINDAVTLDPTEEKILFGSDDNIWDAFGADTITSEGASNFLDDNGFSNGLPSLQSGSWSALMQSAVAETSSSDTGLQEEFAGLSYQNSELNTGAHQPSRYDEGEKHQAVSFVSAPSSDGASTYENLRNAMGFQQYGQEISYEHGEGLQVNSSKRLNQSSGGRKLFNPGVGQKTHAEGSQIFENSSRSLEVRMDVNTHWTSQQIGSNQLKCKSNNWNDIEPVALSSDRAQNLRSEQSMPHPQSNDWKKFPHEEIGHANSIWKVDSVPKSSMNLEHVKSSVGNPRLIREGFAVNAAVSNSSTGPQVGVDNGQFLSNDHPHSYWKHVDSSIKSDEIEGSGKLQHHLSKGPEVLESSLNISEKEELKMREVQSSRRNVNSSSSYQSNTSDLADAGGLMENLSTDAGNSIQGGKQKSSNQDDRKTFAPLKFQYHPMGDLRQDVEQSYETRQGSLLTAMSQQHSSGLKGQDQGQSKLFGQVPKSSADTGKGHVLNQQGEAKGYDETHSRGMLPGYMLNMFGSADRSSASVSIECFSSPLPTNASDQNSVAIRQKKRKRRPWHDEVSQGSQNFLTLSMAEAEWAKAANRRIEKVEDDGEVAEYISPLSRSKRRLLLTTQLMQQPFYPPPATILSADASSNYESVSHFVTRLTLGDACSLISSAKSSSDVPHEGSNLSKPSERTDDQHFSEVMENFMVRARKLENELLSMEKRASVLDLRVECQDLEKFSMINRFAKFHVRRQPEGADGCAAANAQKPVPQRYVTAVPFPKNVPDRVQCLSF